MRTIQLTSWFEMAGAIREIGDRRQDLERQNGRGFEPLFRGLANAEWHLETTLERAHPLELATRITNLATYYGNVYSSKSSIETLMEADWDALPKPEDFRSKLESFRTLPADFFFIENRALYQYLIYLRHHGYPSPLLDWTASPYVAAFFAFDSMPKSAQTVAVYAMLHDSMRISSSDKPTLDVLGPYVRSHRRHLIQQSQYSICMLWHSDFQFCSHDDALSSDGVLGLRGELICIEIPAEERAKALADLDLMNINAYSLFGSEDSLIRTLARREGLLKSSRHL